MAILDRPHRRVLRPGDGRIPSDSKVHLICRTEAESGVDISITGLDGLATPPSVAQGGPGNTGDAWTSYTPAIASGDSNAANVNVDDASYRQAGKTSRLRLQPTATYSPALALLDVALPKIGRVPAMTFRPIGGSM